MSMAWLPLALWIPLVAIGSVMAAIALGIGTAGCADSFDTPCCSDKGKSLKFTFELPMHFFEFHYHSYFAVRPPC